MRTWGWVLAKWGGAFQDRRVSSGLGVRGLETLPCHTIWSFMSLFRQKLDFPYPRAPGSGFGELDDSLVTYVAYAGQISVSLFTCKKQIHWIPILFQILCQTLKLQI